MSGKLQIGAHDEGGFFPRLARAACEGSRGKFDFSARGDATLALVALEGRANRAELRACPLDASTPPPPEPLELIILEPQDGASLSSAVYDILGGGADPGAEVTLWNALTQTPGDGTPLGVATAGAAGGFAFLGDAAAYGAVSWVVMSGGEASDPVNVTGPDAPAAATSWRGLRTHAELNAWAEEHDPLVPEAWFALTVDGKRAWLEERFG